MLLPHLITLQDPVILVRGSKAASQDSLFLIKENLNLPGQSAAARQGLHHLNSVKLFKEDI